MHPKSDFNRLYIPRKDGRRGLIAIEDCVEFWSCMFMEVRKEAASVLKNTKKEKRLQDWKEKALHGQYLRQTKEVRSKQSWV